MIVEAVTDNGYAGSEDDDVDDTGNNTGSGMDAAANALHRSAPAVTLTFAMMVSVRWILRLGCMSYRANSLGDRMAGAKNRRKMKPLTARKGVSWNTHTRTASCLLSAFGLCLRTWPCLPKWVTVTLCPLEILISQQSAERTKSSLKCCKNYENRFTVLVIITIWSRNHHSISFWKIGKQSLYHTVLNNKQVHA